MANKPLSNTAIKLLSRLETRPTAYGKTKRRKKTDCRAADSPPGDLFPEADWRDGLDDETQQRGDKPA